MAVAVEVLEHRHARLVRDTLDQAAPAARDDEVDVLRQRNHLTDRRAIRRFDDLHNGFWKFRRFEPSGNATCDRLVRARRFGATAQHHRVAALEAQARRVGGHIRARFVNDADDAQRHAHLADLNAGRTGAQVRDFAYRVRQLRDLAQAFGHRGDRLRRERQAVNQRRGEIRLLRVTHIGGVFFEDMALALQNRGGDGEKRIVFCRRGGARDGARSGARSAADSMHVFSNVQHLIHAAILPAMMMA